MPVRSYAGAAKRTTLAGDITATSTNIGVVDATGYPTGVDGPFAIALALGNAAEEKILIASRSGGTLTVATGGRGYDGTTAAEHRTGVSVDHVLTAVDVREANAHVNDAAAHGGISAADANAAYLAKTLADAKGDLLAASGPDAFARLAAGADGQVLTADPASPLGVRWAPSNAAAIGRVTLAATAGTITFTGIPGTYDDLLLVLTGGCDGIQAADILLRLNADTGTRYDWVRHSAQNGGSSVTGAAVATAAQIATMGPAAQATSAEIRLPGYARTAFPKTALGRTARFDGVNAPDPIHQSHAGRWRQTAAVTRIDLVSSGVAFAAGTVAVLYGI